LSPPRIHALIPAAGFSVRFGGTTLKQYAHLLGRPVIAYSIEAIKNHPAVTDVTVALAEDDGLYDQLVRPLFPDVGTTTGGPSRAHTVMNGLKHILEIDPDAEWVLVHDAARPCLPRKALDELIRVGLTSRDGAILAIRVSDTIKRGGADDLIEETVNREGLWRAQTPQLFPAKRLAKALSDALGDRDEPTDEAAAMERDGARPKLVTGSQTNIKITGPEDLELAELLLKSFGPDATTGNHANTDRTGV
jgi:2-C-methyl-D-erythritol 4-phosphate cytidylyltransferase